MAEVDRARRARERGDGRTWRERALDAEADREADRPKTLKGYVYTCDAHSLGELVRRVEAEEMGGIYDLGKTLRHDHATNCWVRGCQNELTQVRLVEMT